MSKEKQKDITYFPLWRERGNDDNSLSSLICTPFTGQLVKGDFLCAIPMNSKNIALTCIGKGNIRKHLKA
ncbi:hypothetical protein, partial [Allisonella histaminiformans]|uniref:hypothetical protein n=1 Tax=Allisonella histaminiformans TaxID=209880 RepID=UPI002E76D0A0